MHSGDDVSVGTFISVRFGFEFRTFENHRRICRREVGVFTVDRFGRPSFIFEDLLTFLSAMNKARLSSLRHEQKIATKYRYNREHRPVKILILNGKQPGEERYQDEPVNYYCLYPEQTPIKNFAFKSICVP